MTKDVSCGCGDKGNVNCSDCNCKESKAGCANCECKCANSCDTCVECKCTCQQSCQA